MNKVLALSAAFFHSRGKTYELAVGLIKKGLAYVCELTPEQFREYRGDR